MNIFSIAGRIGRLRFVLWMIPLWCLTVPILVEVTQQEVKNQPVLFIISLVILALSIFPIAKRLHDINVSGWFWFVIFVPLMNILMFLYLLLENGVDGPNKYGVPSEKAEDFIFFSIEPGDDDSSLYQRAYEELESGQINKALWAKVFALSGGDESRSKAQYLKNRVEQFKVEQSKSKEELPD